MHIIKYDFSLVSLSSVSLICRLVKEPRRVEGSHFSFPYRVLLPSSVPKRNRIPGYDTRQTLTPSLLQPPPDSWLGLDGGCGEFVCSLTHKIDLDLF
jgi:hypothetical protein